MLNFSIEKTKMLLYNYKTKKYIVNRKNINRKRSTMESKEKEQINARKKNMRIYSVHRMLTFDLLFYYAIKFLFLTQVKGFTEVI